MIFKLSITIIVLMLYTIDTQSTSKYKGVSWNKPKKLWQAECDFNGKKQKSYFKNELDAAKQINKICVKMGIFPQNPEISEAKNQQDLKKESTKSQYTGVSWHNPIGKWIARIQLLNEEKLKYGGIFLSELNAAKRVNQLCKEFGIPPKNPGITNLPTPEVQTTQKTSQYKGVSYDKRDGKWIVKLYLKGQKYRYGGVFNDELEAAKRMNELCKEIGMSPKNPGISAIPNQQYQYMENTSKYKGVHFHIRTGKWHATLHMKGKKQQHGGTFTNELDAAKRVNQLCKESEIPVKNPGISSISNQEDDDNKTIDSETVNSIVVSEITKPTDDDTRKNENKRKRKKEFINHHIEQFYIHDHLLK